MDRFRPLIGWLGAEHLWQEEIVTPHPQEHFLSPRIPGPVEGWSLNVWSSPWLLASFLSLRTTVTHEVLHRNRFVFLDTEGHCLGKQHQYMQLNHIPFRQKTLHRKDSSFAVYSQGTVMSVISLGWLTKPFQLNASACGKRCVSVSSIRLDWVTGQKDHSVISTQLSP